MQQTFHICSYFNEYDTPNNIYHTFLILLFFVAENSIRLELHDPVGYLDSEKHTAFVGNASLIS